MLERVLERAEMKISILGSGSGGNATFIETEGVKFLVDAGFSGKKLKERMETIGEQIEELDAILITHEHGDHIMGAGILSRKHNIPLYITRESYEAGEKKLGKIAKENIRFIEGDFNLNSKVRIRPFDVLHDASRTIGFRVVNSSGKRLAIATDIGYIDKYVREYFKGVDILVIECNYDYGMLMTCSYPWDLKNRVKSNNGHLANEEAGKLIADVYHSELKKVYLVHVSKDSNKYMLALDSVREKLSSEELDVELEVAYQDKATDIFSI